MSASREKKQRQSAGPSEKAAKAQQEQAARKRSIIIYSAVGAVAAVLVIALLVWRSGFFQARAAAATVGGETLTAADLSFYYASARSSFVNYGILDSTKSDDQQIYSASDNKTYRDLFLETALTNAQQHMALANKAVEAGYTEADVKDALQAEIDGMKAAASANGLSYAAYLRSAFGSYMSPAVYERLTTRYLMARLAAADRYDELFDGYTQADLDAYYKDHADSLDTIEYSHLYFQIPTVNTKDEEGNELPEDELQKRKDEAAANAKKSAEDALAECLDGESFAQLIERYSPTSSADHQTVVGTGRLNTAYSEQLLKLDKDECQLVETDNGYYVIAFHGRFLEDEPSRDMRHILVRAETGTDSEGKVTAPTDEAWAAAKTKMDEIQAAWDGGAKTEDAFAALANEKSEDQGSNTNGGLYERVSNGGLVPEFNEWLFDDGRAPGDVEVIRHEAGDSDGNKYWGYHMAYYVGENEPAWMGTVRDTLAGEGQNEWIDQQAEAYPAALAGGADYLGR